MVGGANAAVCVGWQEEMLDAAARARIDFNTQLRCNRQSTLFQVRGLFPVHVHERVDHPRHMVYGRRT